MSTVADLGEFGLIAAIRALFPPAASQLVGIGDDAAVLRAPDGRVVATTDLLVEGRHFRREWSGPADVGRKAAAQNMADIAAMGATATVLLVGLAAPGDLPVAWAEDLARGLAAEATMVGASVAGGDVTGADVIMVAVAALGDLAGRPPVTRGGAQPGDVLAVAGTLGGSAAGLALLAAGRSGGPASSAAEPQLASLVAAHRRPRPPYRAGPQAAAAGATSMIDISDGLVQDTGHVAAASGVAIDIDSHLLTASPVVPAAALRAAAALVGCPDWFSWVLTGGEDHALAATFAPGSLPAGWSAVGRAGPGRGVTVDGRSREGAGGWDHFRGGPA